METKSVSLEEAGVCVCVERETDAGSSIEERMGVVSCWKQTSHSNYLNQIQALS